MEGAVELRVGILAIARVLLREFDRLLAVHRFCNNLFSMLWLLRLWPTITSWCLMKMIRINGMENLTKSSNRYPEFNWRNRWEYQSPIHVLSADFKYFSRTIFRLFLHFQSFNSWYRTRFVHWVADKNQITILIYRKHTLQYVVNWIIQRGSSRRDNYYFSFRT